METLHRPVVVVADDHPGIRQLMRVILEPDWVVVEAATGAQALEAVEAYLPELLLLDLHLPPPNGLAVLRALAADPDLRAVRCVVLTGSGDESLMHEALAAGAAAVLRKPFEIGDLQAQVSAALGGALPPAQARVTRRTV